MTASAESTRALSAIPLTHVDARRRWGLPDDSEGNVNNPRTSEEHGRRFNEKWIYFLPGGARRLVYWHRYDCRGVLIERADGSVSEESL